MRIEIKKAESVREIEDLLGEKSLSSLKGHYYLAIVRENERDMTAGVVGVLKRSWYLTEIRHLLVRESWRDQGIGRLLVQSAMKNVRTPLICATVRADNLPALRLFENTGFTRVLMFKNPVTGKEIFFMARMSEGS